MVSAQLFSANTKAGVCKETKMYVLASSSDCTSIEKEIHRTFFCFEFWSEQALKVKSKLEQDKDKAEDPGAKVKKMKIIATWY